MAKADNAAIEQHREADALWRSIRFQPQDDAYLVVLSLVTERDRLAAVADAARLWVATEDAILSSPGISGTEAWNRTRKAHRDAASALAVLDQEEADRG